METLEIWLKTYLSDTYEVSNKGRVRSIERYTTDRNGRRTFQAGRILIPHPGRAGYLAVNIMTHNKKGEIINKVTMRVHRLVAIAFIHNPENKPEVNHINANKNDNSVANLQWHTRIENMKHCNDLNLIPPNKKGEESTSSKLKNEDVLEIRRLRLDGQTLTSIAKKYNISISNVFDIYKRNIWKHI